MRVIKGNTWAVGGGKGGVGKSFIASNLACGLALSGYKVILVDADLAGANIHTLFGIRYPDRTLEDFLKKRVERFHDILTPTSVSNLHIICGASDFLELANPEYGQKQKLIRGISSLDADYILIDIGAGASLNNLDFFNMADIGIIVTSPSPTAIQNAYGFLKMAVNRLALRMFADMPSVKEQISSAFRDRSETKNLIELIEMIKEIDEEAPDKVVKMLIEKRYGLLVNMATESESERVAKVMSGVASQFLRIKLPYIGAIGHDAEVEESIRRMKPLMLSGNTSVSNSIMRIVRKINAETNSSQKEVSQEVKKEESGNITKRRESISRMQQCLNNEIVYEGRVLHVQTEDLGVDKSQILTLVFSGGHILFSKSIGYKELIDDEKLQQTVRDKVRRQHMTTIAGITKGKLSLSEGDR